MAKVTVSVEVEAKAYEVGQALRHVVATCKAALADGFQAGQDLPVILVGSVTDLLKVVGDVGSLPAEAKEDANAFRKALVLSADDILGDLLPKQAAPVAAEVAAPTA